MTIRSFLFGLGALALALGPASANDDTHPSRPLGVDLASLNGLATNRGGALQLSGLRGRPFVLLFGYTHCPELCPTALFDLTRHLATLGVEADRLGVVFVTVDPERDTPEVLREYLASFDPRIIGVTGTVDQIKGVATAFGTRFERRGVRSDYSMDHPYMLFLVDKYGLLARAVGYDDPEGLASYSNRVLAQ